MVEHIEGKWKIFEFKMIQPSDYPRILDHLHKNFFNSTPLTQGLEYSKEYHEEFDKVYETVLPQNLSFYALDTETNQIAGLRITFINDKALDNELWNIPFKTRQMEVMTQVMGKVNVESNIYERYGIESFVNFYTACVDPKYQGQGLATEMYERALNFIRSKDKFQFVKSNLTSPYTRRICHKYGFKELARAYYNDFRDENNIPLVKGRTDEEFVSFMCLNLRE